MKTKIFADGFDGHVRRSLERAAKMDRGERVEAQRVITFADPLDMMQCLTAERVRIFEVVRKKRLSVSALAEELGRFLTGEPIQARPASRMRRAVSWSRRHPWAIAGAVSALVLTLVCLAYGLWEKPST